MSLDACPLCKTSFLTKFLPSLQLVMVIVIGPIALYQGTIDCKIHPWDPWVAWWELAWDADLSFFDWWQMTVFVGIVLSHCFFLHLALLNTC